MEAIRQVAPPRSRHGNSRRRWGKAKTIHTKVYIPVASPQRGQTVMEATCSMPDESNSRPLYTQNAPKEITLHVLRNETICRYDRLHKPITVLMVIRFRGRKMRTRPRDGIAHNTSRGRRAGRGATKTDARAEDGRRGGRRGEGKAGKSRKRREKERTENNQRKGLHCVARIIPSTNQSPHQLNLWPLATDMVIHNRRGRGYEVANKKTKNMFEKLPYVLH